MLQDINMVSAPAIATERGMAVSESRQELSAVYDSLVRITMTGPWGERVFAGTVVAGAPRVVEINGVELDAPFAPAMLYSNNEDKPGFIGSLGVLLGDRGVNIATFNLGRTSAGGDAIALVGVDQPSDEALLAEVRALPHVREARALRF
jgi:D-3-phosphoglycerate dehydrogenase